MPTYPTRKIGQANVPAISFGTMGASQFYGPVAKTDEERFKLFDRAFELGITHWDTSDRYGDSEDLIGRWLKKTGKRESIFLATKFGITENGVRGDKQYIREAIQSSLSRLGVDYIDLYYAHRIDPTIPIEETVSAMAELVKEGKVKYLGLSEASARTLRRACAVHPISAIQMEYSPFCLEIESNDERFGVLSAAKELGVTVVAYSPLGRGMLTGKYRSPDDFEPDDLRRSGLLPRFSKENFPNMLKLVDVLREIGKKYNATSGQVCLAWMLAQGDHVVPIPGTKNIKYLEENRNAANVSLSTEDIQAVRKAAIESGSEDLPRYIDAWLQISVADTPLPANLK